MPSEKKVELDNHSARDSFIPLFDGSLTGYREWRKRITIYYKKMSLSKRQGEAILNLLGSLSGTAWKFCEDFNIDKAEDPDALNQILKILDGSFQYDSNVEMPADFSGYFENLARKPGQTLLSFVTDHDDRLKQIEKHGVRLPSQVQGWFLLAKASLTREKRQMIMTQAASLERPKVQQAMLAILGQDYKGGGNLLRDRWNRSNSGKGRSYFAGDDESTPDWGDEDTYYEEDDADYMNEEETMDDTWWETFDADAAYYQEDYDEPELEFDPGEYHEAYASYVDARKRFNDLKLSRGFLPVVALQDASSSSSTPSQRPFKGLGKGKKGKGKGKGKSATYRYDKAPAKQPDEAVPPWLPPACAVVQHPTRRHNVLSRQLRSPQLHPPANGRQSRAWQS